MSRAKRVFFAAIIFAGSFLNASHLKDTVFCEPSILFPEIAFIEQAECFSYTVANRTYEENRTLRKYLGRFPENIHQKGYRYLYYLRENNYLAAVITLIDMVNTETLISTVTDPSKELGNTLLQGIKVTNSGDISKNLQPFENNQGPKKIEVLDREFFSLLSYVASYASEQSGLNRDSTIVFRTLSILLSNIATGVDWEGDTFIHERFNRLVVAKNEGLLESYISLFFFHSRGDSHNLPSFTKYLKLKDAGVVSDSLSRRSLGPEASSVRKVIAGFFLDNLHKMPRIIVADVLPSNEDPLRNELCNYLDNRREWFSSVPGLGEDVMYFNEAVKIVEQCGGSLSFPFVIDGDRIYILKDSLWLTDVAVSLRYLMSEDMGVKDGDTVLRGAVRASLEKAGKRKESSLDEEFMIYSVKIGKSSEVLRSFFARSLSPDSEKSESENINDAAFFLSKILF